MFDNQNNYEVEFSRGRYSNETFLIPDEFEHDIYTFELTRRRNVDIDVFPNGGRVDLELYQDSNNNGRLDRSDRRIDRSNTSGDQSLNNRLAQGTYFTHVGLGRLDRGKNILEYVIEIDTNSNNNSRPPLLFEEKATNYEVEFRRGSYSNESFLIPNEFEHDIYTFELTRRTNVDIDVFPNGGRVDLELYQDSNNNGRLDRDDQRIDRSNTSGNQSLNNRLAQGTYFTHVGLGRLNRGEDELNYEIEIDTNSNNNSRPPLLFEEKATNYEVEFRRGSYSNESFLIPNEFEHDIYTFELTRRTNVDIDVFPNGGRVDLELYQDSNNNGRLDRDDQRIDRSNTSGNQSLNNRLAQGTYFTHVGLGRLDRGEDELNYEIEINTNSNNNSRPPLLFEENATNYEVEFRRGSYSNESFLIPNEFEHDIYKIELNSREQIRISARPFNGSVTLELYQDDNNNGVLDRDDDLIETSDHQRGREVLTDTVPRGTYFAHVGFSKLNSGEDELNYSIEIETSSNSSRISSLSEEIINSDQLGRNNNSNSWIPMESTEDVYGLNGLSDSIL